MSGRRHSSGLGNKVELFILHYFFQMPNQNNDIENGFKTMEMAFIHDLTKKS